MAGRIPSPMEIARTLVSHLPGLPQGRFFARPGGTPVTGVQNIGQCKLLGIGGTSEVFRAWDETCERWVALKMTRPTWTPNGYWTIPNEWIHTRGPAFSTHPNLVRVGDVFREDPFFFMEMELLDGRTIDTLINGGQIFDPRDAVKIVLQALGGLRAAGRRRMGDLKPGNVFLNRLADDCFQVKLIDFGCAEYLDPRLPSFFSPGSPPGTFIYGAPELIKGKPGRGRRSDLFSLGMTFYEMLTGRHPFLNIAVNRLRSLPTWEDYLSRIRTAKPPPLFKIFSCENERQRGALRELDQILRPLLNPRYTDRPNNFRRLEYRLVVWLNRFEDVEFPWATRVRVV